MYLVGMLTPRATGRLMKRIGMPISNAMLKHVTVSGLPLSYISSLLFPFQLDIAVIIQQLTKGHS